MADATGDVVRHGAFTKSIADHKQAGTMPALLWAHDQQNPIGKYTSMREDANGLLVTGKLALNTQRGSDAYELMKMDALALSIGYRVVAASYLPKHVRSLDVVAVHEISTVAMPANSRAKIISVKARPTVADVNNPRALERVLMDSGWSRSQAKKIAFLSKTAFKPLDVAMAEHKLARKLLTAARAFSHHH